MQQLNRKALQGLLATTQSRLEETQAGNDRDCLNSEAEGSLQLVGKAAEVNTPSSTRGIGPWLALMRKLHLFAVSLLCHYAGSIPLAMVSLELF